MLPIELERVLCFGPRKLTMVWGPKGVASTVCCSFESNRATESLPNFRIANSSTCCDLSWQPCPKREHPRSKAQLPSDFQELFLQTSKVPSHRA